MSRNLTVVIGCIAMVSVAVLLTATTQRISDDVPLSLGHTDAPPPRVMAFVAKRVLTPLDQARVSSGQMRLDDSLLEGSQTQLVEVVPTNGRCTRDATGTSSCDAADAGMMKLMFKILVRRPKNRWNTTTCRNASSDFDDALEISIASDRALLTAYDVRRATTHSSGGAALYVASADVYESGTYVVGTSVRFFCGDQLATWLTPSPGPISKVVKPHPPWVTRWSTAPLHLSLDLASKWTSQHCVVDESLAWDDRHVKRDHAATTLAVVLGRAPPTMPPCTDRSQGAANSLTFNASGGRWVNLRRVFSDAKLTQCRPPYCVGDFHAVLVKDDPEALNQTAMDQGWVYVPGKCMLEYPATQKRAWQGLAGKILLLLGDSTTSDTVYHFIRSVLRSPSNPPRNRWSDPFEMVIRGPDDGLSIVLRQNRVGNMERDRASGWFDNLRGLQHFHAPYQIGKLAQWVGEGRSVVNAQIRPAGVVKHDDGHLTIEGKRGDARKSDVEVSTVDRDAMLDGVPDAILVHSGPHDRRHPGHTVEQFAADLRHMDSVLRAMCKHTPRNPVRIWRSNVVSAGPYYRCSRLENPWIYRAMDRAAQRELFRSWTSMDMAPLTAPWHWGLNWSDGIHYGRYAARYRKLTQVDRASAVMWWNTLMAFL